MRVLITGGREYALYGELCKVLDDLHAERKFTLLVHGDAGLYKQGYRERPVAFKGADALSGRWADERGIQQVKVPANWEGFGDRAGMRRNKLMLDLAKPDVCIAFPGGRGTANMMRLTREAGVELIDVEDILLS